MTAAVKLCPLQNPALTSELILIPKNSNIFMIFALICSHPEIVKPLLRDLPISTAVDSY